MFFPPCATAERDSGLRKCQIPGIPQILEFHKIPQIPEFSNPRIPQIPGIPQIPEFPKSREFPPPHPNPKSREFLLGFPPVKTSLIIFYSFISLYFPLFPFISLHFSLFSFISLYFSLIWFISLYFSREAPSRARWVTGKGERRKNMNLNLI